MKTATRFLALLIILPGAFLLYSHAAHASYQVYNYSFPGIEWGGNNGRTLNDFLPDNYLNALAADIYYNSYSGAGCTGGQCGLPYACTGLGGDCDGNTPYGNFYGRMDNEHQFGDPDKNYFKNGYPGQLMGWNDSYGDATALRACQVFSAVDSGGTVDPTLTEHITTVDGNGDDGSYRNNISFYGTGWDIFGANHHYSKLSGDDRNSGNAIGTMVCYSSQKPVQAFTINNGSTATVKAGQTVNLAWSDNDYYANAQQTCTASTDNTDPNGAFAVPTPPASKTPYATCYGTQTPDLIVGKQSSADPGQTSTLTSVPTDSQGNALYEYGCVETYPNSSAGCQGQTHTCAEWSYENGRRTCDEYYDTAWCPVAPPKGSVAVTSATPGTYHYHYNCTNLAGETDKTVTLVVTAGDTLPDLTANNLATVPAQPVVNQAATISATFSNSNATSTGTGFSDLFQIDPPEDTDHSNPTNIATSSPVLIAGASNSRSISYTFNEQGTWYLRACADEGTNGQGTIAESNETNNCTNGGAWTGITVKGVTVTLSCSVDTTLPVDAGSPVKLTAHPGGFTAPLTYTWTTSPGSSCGNTNPCNTTYSTAGDYTPSVKVTDSMSNQMTATCAPDVTVRPICTVNPPSGTVPITVTWTASGGGSYAWYDGADNDLNDHTSQYSNTFTQPNNYGAYVVSAGQKSTTCVTNLTSCNQNPRGSLSANPTRVATGTASTLTYSNLAGIPAVSECYIVSVPSNGNQIDLGLSTDSCSLSGGAKSSGAINTQTLFKIVCGNQDVNGATTTVDVAPDINEF